MKVGVFSWNTASVRLSETLVSEIHATNRRGYLEIPRLTSYQFAATIPDFVEQIMTLFADCDIIVWGLQEDAYPGSYFHSDLLVNLMPTYGYSLVTRAKMIGVGKTTVKSLPSDMVLRGLRTSVYVKTALDPSVTGIEIKYHTLDQVFQSKGAVSIRFTIDQTTYNCINVHLPHDAISLKSVRTSQYLRRQAVLQQHMLFNSMLEKLIIPTDQTILFGDFNYRVTPGCTTIDDCLHAVLMGQYSKLLAHDELRAAINSNLLPALLEGVDNEGPTFAPTAKLHKNRTTTTDYNLGKCKQRVPSWCDRILSMGMNCTAYDRIDTPVMAHSDHAGIYAIFQ